MFRDESLEETRAPILKKDGQDGAVVVDQSTSKFRLVFLTLNISVNILMLGLGILVYSRTKSLSVMMDWLGGAATLVALIACIAVEFWKTRVQSTRQVLILDLSGCVLSVVLLLGVTIFGIVDAVVRTQEDHEKQVSDRLDNLDDMIVFSAVSFTVDIVTLLFYSGLRKWMLEVDDKKSDELTVLSSLLHLITDLGSSLVILVTALVLKFGNFSGETWQQFLAHEIFIDSSGGIVVCICLIVAVVSSWKDAAKSVELIHKLDDESNKQVDYGTMDGKLSDWDGEA